MDIDHLMVEIEQGNRSALGKAITLIESEKPSDRKGAKQLLNWALSRNRLSLRIGITGVPGAGKSTLIESFGLFLMDQGHKVAVLAVDPSSQKTHGSILGDKTRMIDLSRHPNAFIRPSAAGKKLGGVADRTRETMLICEAAGYDVILIETVGVGQSEVTVKNMVDFFLLVLVAGAGDELQGMKRGIMEMADTIAINKADGDNVTRAKSSKMEYARALGLMPIPESGIKASIKTCSALDKQGIDELWETIQKHITHTQKSGFFESNRKKQSVRWMLQSLERRIIEEFYQSPNVATSLEKLKSQVEKGEIDPVTAADRLLTTFKSA